MNRTWLFTAFVFPLLASSAPAGPARVTADRVIQALIRDLGAESYTARERATTALRLVGQPARKALEKAAESDDPEVRLRARDVLSDVVLGIGPDWPADIVLLVRHFDDMQQHERSNAIYRIAQLGAKAVPFLLKRMETGTPSEANWALNALQQRANNAEVCEEVIRLLGEPANDQQARALAWARAQRGQALAGIEAIVTQRPADLKINKATEVTIEDSLARLRAGKAQEVLAEAENLAKADPADPRALYLQAEALILLNRDKEALSLRDKAVALSPDQQQPHYLAAEMLTRLGRHRLAVKEWQRVIETEPADTECDATAYLNLGAIHTANGLFESAAQYLEKALQTLSKSKDQEKVKPLASALQMEVDRLRQRAASFPVSPEAVVEDAVPANELQLEVRVIPKEGKVEDLQKALATTAAQFQIMVELPEVAILDLPAAALRYDKAKKQLLLLLHDSPACDPLPFDLQGNEARVALHLPGITYLYKVEASGTAERLARFEKDYQVTLKPGLKVSGLASPALRINGVAYEWEKALAGIPFARLPEQFDVIVEGTAPLGRRMTVRATVAATEPAPEGPKPASEPASKP
ncbi:MAG TPA: hypothetical protein PLE19_21275 [Planctomycetota bacterium]|nr:hypothetical protein [Planctomycetota bacterium]HRR82159.1 hypothetical protein [Planctomycetota bacterium]HRT96280.1 hypothetical protein [Planctomycetota bacterium]